MYGARTRCDELNTSQNFPKISVSIDAKYVNLYLYLADKVLAPRRQNVAEVFGVFLWQTCELAAGDPGMMASTCEMPW
jgi:hypothetical protein